MTGWYGLTCWNGLSTEQQRKLIERGSLNDFDPEDSTPHGECANPAEVAIETVHDEAPGPRFYCRTCAAAYLTPATTVFNAEGFMNPHTARSGPLEVFIGQSAWVEHSRPEELARALDRALDVMSQDRRLRDRLWRRNRLFLIIHRLEPPADEPLIEWGTQVGERLGMTVPEPEPNDRAVWLTGAVWAREAGEALASAGRVMQTLRGIKISRGQVRVFQGAGYQSPPYVRSATELE